MTLNELLTTASNQKKIGVSEERVEAVKPIMRLYIAYWREYPDMLVDFLLTGYDPTVQPTFALFFYQRIFLRVVARYRYVYAVYPRGYSKSFLNIIAQMLRCVLYPNAHLFVTAGGKEQAAQIMEEKVQDICQKIPAFKREIDWRRGQTTEGKDHCRYVFKNGSDFVNVAARESSRGIRKHGGTMEECVGIDQKILQEVIIPQTGGLVA